MDGLLKYEDGLIRLGSHGVPGVLKRLTIRGEIQFDQFPQDQKSGSAKTPMGWRDSAITIVVDLLTDEKSTCYEKLEYLNAIYRGYDNGVNPKVFTVSNSHIDARGIDRVVFAGLESVESDEEDTIQATLRLSEHNPAVVRVEKARSRSKVDKPTAKPVADAAIMGAS